MEQIEDPSINAIVGIGLVGWAIASLAGLSIGGLFYEIAWIFFA
jgi:hypothetical protein